MADNGENGTPKTFTQEEVNELMGKLRREVTGKYADYDALKEKATAYDEAQEAAAKAKAEADALRAEKERAALVAKVSEATGVPASLIQGEDEEAMAASAKAIAEYARSASTKAPDDKGGAASSAKASTKDQFTDVLSKLMR